ncbi:MAG: hypothetical protein AAGB06_06795, partial [Verrucomicrobiota bacterium]
MIKIAAFLGSVIGLVSISHAADKEAPSNPVSAKANKLILDAKFRTKTDSSDFVIVEYVITESGGVRKPQVIATTKPVLTPRLLSEIPKWRF